MSDAQLGESAPRPGGPAERWRWAWPALVGGVLLLMGIVYLASIPPTWYVHGDGAVYIGLGRSLARGQGYTFNYLPFGKYPPVFPLMIAAVYATVGQSFWAMQALVALCGVGTAAAVYALVVPRAGREAALAVAALTGTCTWFWVFSCAQVLPEVPYALFSVAALWYAERQIRAARFSLLKWVLAALLVALAITTHMSGVALVPAVAAGALFARGQRWPVRRRLAAAALVGAIGTGVAVAWVARGWNSPVGMTYRGMVTAPVHNLPDPVLKLQLRVKEWSGTPLSLDDISVALGAVLLGTLLVPGLVSGFRRHRSAAEFYVPFAFLLSYFHGGYGGYERYVVPLVPLLLYYGYLSVRVWGGLLARLAGAGRLERAPWLPRAALGLVLVVLLGSALYSRHRCRGGADDFSDDEMREKAEAFYEWEAFGDWARQEVPEGDTLFTGGGGAWAVLHFFTEHRVGRCSSIDRGRQVLRDMARSGASLAVVEKGYKSNGLRDVLKRHPGCFTQLRKGEEVKLYSIDRERLSEILDKPAPSDGEPDAPQEQGGPEGDD